MSLIQVYIPQKKLRPKNIIDVHSAWKGLELIIDDILCNFNIHRNSCIEFGVQFGYSTVVFSNYFEHVIGIDTFKGDIHTIHKGDHYEKTKKRLSDFQNIKLIKSDYRDWIGIDNKRYNLAHVDIVHNYEETYECGLWAAKHSDCTIFHDTESFPSVRKAVIDISQETGQELFNYPYCFGLGILVDKNIIIF